MTDRIAAIEFLHPWALILLLVIPAMTLWYIFRQGKIHTALRFSSSAVFENTGRSWRIKFRHLPFILRMITVALIIVILARPQSKFDRTDYKVEGIDIMMAIDISGSMLAEDFKPNRLEAAKDVAAEFIDGRRNDRIGLIVFSAESFLQCPLTIDHPRLKNFFSEIRSGMVTDGTAIGDGLGLAVYHISKSDAVSKVIILLTDGINNAGSVDPMTAAEIAKKYNVRVYTIGVGSEGMAPYPFPTPYGVQYQNMKVLIDETLLQNIATATGGSYFRATDNEKLRGIYRQIDEMEKSRIDVTRFSKRKEEFLMFAIAAVVLMITEILLRLFVFRHIP